MAVTISGIPGWATLHGKPYHDGGLSRQQSSRTRVTTAVQPVWWLAPSPCPVSPWKYSQHSPSGE
jgi:hypothetical protein